MHLTVQRLSGKYGAGGTGTHWTELLSEWSAPLGNSGVGVGLTRARVLWCVPEPDSGLRVFVERGGGGPGTGLLPSCWVGLDDGRIVSVGRDGVIIGVWMCALVASAGNDAQDASATFIDVAICGAARVAGRANELMFFQEDSRKVLFARFPQLGEGSEAVFCVYECEDPVTSCYVCHEGDFLIIGDIAGGLHAVEIASGALVGIKKAAHGGRINCITGSPGSPPIFASCAGDDSVAVWRVTLNDFQCLFRTRNADKTASVRAIALDVVVGGPGRDTLSFQSDLNKGQVLAVATTSDSVLLWSSGPKHDWTNLPSISTSHCKRGHGAESRRNGKDMGSSVSSMAISYENALLAVGCTSGKMKIYDMHTASLLKETDSLHLSASTTGPVIACISMGGRGAGDRPNFVYCTRQGPPIFEPIRELRALKEKTLKTTVHPIAPRDPVPQVPSLVALRNIETSSLPLATTTPVERGGDPSGRPISDGGTAPIHQEIPRECPDTRGVTGRGANGDVRATSPQQKSDPGMFGRVIDARGGEGPAQTAQAHETMSMANNRGRSGSGGPAPQQTAPPLEASDSVEELLEREFVSLTRDLEKLKEAKRKVGALQRMALEQQQEVHRASSIRSETGIGHLHEGVRKGDTAPSALAVPVLNSTSRTIKKANELTRSYIADTAKQKQHLESLISIERELQETCASAANAPEKSLTKIDNSVSVFVPKKVGKQLDPRWVACHSVAPKMSDHWTAEQHEPQVFSTDPVPYKAPPSFYASMKGGFKARYIL